MDTQVIPNSDGLSTTHYMESVFHTPQMLHANPDTLKTPDALEDKYTYLRKLGHGTQGNVFEAVRKSDGTHVAIKQLRIDSVTNWKAYDLFQRESEVLSSLNVKGVATFHEAIEDLESDHPAAYIVQQFISGKSLGDMMKSGFRFTITRIFELAQQLLDILQTLHSHNPPVIHRDIKPSNILLQPTTGDNYDLYLIDFGAVANPQVQAGGSTIAGTFGFMSPEQLVGHPEPASDIYSMGAMLAYLLSGVEPCNMRVADFRLIIDPFLENIPRAVVILLHQMLDPDPKKRLTDYEYLREMFNAFANNHFMQKDQPILSDDDYDKKLTKIKKLNQPGALELWMNLPEKVPRKVPQNYIKRLWAIHHKLRDSYEISDSSDRHNHYIFLKCGIALFIITPVIIHFTAPLFLVVFMTCILPLSLLIFLAICSQLYFPKTSSASLFQRDNDITRKFNLDRNLEDVGKLMNRGKKTIATILSCSYVPVGSFNNLTELPYTSHQPNFTYPQPPLYTIKYKFNPPDDSSPNDLIHTISLHHDITHDFEPGTPLPILYYIDPHNNAKVISMPYPLPNDPYLPFDHIVGSSYDGE